jgi:hypothetical protein
MKLSAASIAAAALLASASANATVVELAKNGSFEANSISQGWTTMPGLNDWSVGQNGVEVRNNNAGAASDGSVYLELDTFANSWISQSIATTAGGVYKLSFDYSPREGTSWMSNAIEVFWGGQSFGVITGNGGQSGNHWMHVSMQLAGLSQDTTLEFRAVGISDGAGGSLDNVSVTTEVPEPGTLATFALGLGLLGFTLRRKA